MRGTALLGLSSCLASCFVVCAVIGGGACGPGGRGDVPHPVDAGGPMLTGISIVPADATVTTSDTMPGDAQFAAVGIFLDGHQEDVTSQVTWSLADPALGSVGAGHFIAGTVRGGSTNVQATLGGQTGSASVTIVLSAARVSTDDGSTAPADSASQFGGTEDPTVAPTIVYPLDGTLLPQNLGALEIQWQSAATAADLYEVSLQGKVLDLHAYTNAVRPGGSRYFLQGDDWNSVASTVGSASGGGLVTLTITARSAADHSKIGTSKSISFTIGSDDVQGGIYYWSATGGSATEGIFRHSFGDTTSLAKPYITQADGYTTPGGANHCVACHALSRDGTRMALTYDGGGAVAGIIDVATKMPIIPATMGLHWNFASFNPDGTRVVVAANNQLKDGSLLILDAATGMQVDSVPTTHGTVATHPDWSPDGKVIAYAATPVYSNDWTFNGASIVIATDIGAGFAHIVPKVLVASSGENNYYPSISPDGRWILFNRSMGNAYNNSDATVWLVATDGSIGPLHLTSADVAPNTDSWCRWSPFVQKNGPDGDLLYFTNSSKRDYGIELVAQQRPQVWMAAFNPKNGEPGAMPVAYPPFWLPFQDSSTANHIAQWTTTIVGIQ